MYNLYYDVDYKIKVISKALLEDFAHLSILEIEDDLGLALSTGKEPIHRWVVVETPLKGVFLHKLKDEPVLVIAHLERFHFISTRCPNPDVIVSWNRAARELKVRLLKQDFNEVASLPFYATRVSDPFICYKEFEVNLAELKKSPVALDPSGLPDTFGVLTRFYFQGYRLDLT